MLKNLNISNFRCFTDFHLEKAAHITLISGRNNVGKTALLESMFLLFASTSPDAFIKTNLIRGNLLTAFNPDVTWEHLFYNRNLDLTINIGLELNDESITLQLSRNSQILMNPLNGLPPNFQIMPNSYGLTIRYEIGSTENTGICFPSASGLTIHWNHATEQYNLPNVKYIGIAPDNEQNLAILFGQVIKSGQRGALIEELQLLEPELMDVSTVAEDTPRLYAQKRNGPMLPLSSMGNGICRLAQILCAICEQRKSIVLVDEIDSGFHYSFFNKLWQIISTIAKKNDVHVVATTHSYECLKGASACFDNPDDDFTYIRLGKDGSGRILPHIYSPDMMVYAIESEMELR